jgi:hypothetical protein
MKEDFSEPANGCKTKLKLTSRTFADEGYEYMEMKWNAIPGAIDYTVFSNGDGWANLPNFKVEIANSKERSFTANVDKRKLNEFFVRANPNPKFRCNAHNVRA